MKHELSACILTPTLAVLYTWLKMHALSSCQFLYLNLPGCKKDAALFNMASVKKF